MKNQLRVALLTNFLPPYNIPLLEHLAYIGEFRVSVSTPMEEGRTWQPSWGRLNVSVERTLTIRHRWVHEQGFADDVSLHFPYTTILRLAEWRPQVVISAQFGFRTAQAAIYRRIFPESRLILWATLSEHTEKGLSKFRMLQRMALLKTVDAAIVNGISGEKYLMGLGMLQKRIFHLPYCPDVSQFTGLPTARSCGSARRLLYVGQLVERKGLLPFLAVLSEWCHKHPDVTCELWIAGHGPLRIDLERIPVPANLRRRFLGAVEYEKLSAVYCGAGILVFPTLADEWGVVVNEALAAGLPVLGSVYGEAVNELVEEGKTGWTFHPDQAVSVYEAIDRAMTCAPEELNEMRRAARLRAFCFSPEYGAKCIREAINFVRGSRGNDELIGALGVGEQP